MGQQTQWQNRIVGYGEESPDQLCANPLNFRTHPKNQQDALAGVLSEVGIVQNVIVNRSTGYVIDGHLRISLALRDHQPTVPVTYVDLTPAEEALILASLDPISAMATADRDKLDELLREVSTSDAAVMQMLSELAEQNGIIGADWDESFGALPDGDKAPFEQMTFTLHSSQADSVKTAIEMAKSSGAFIGSPNENSNGNALARICEAYINA